MDRESDKILSTFHPAVRKWFTTHFDSVTEPQKLAFPHIKRDENVLLLSPTGSGKTLAGFLVSIDHLVCLAERNQLEDMVYLIYVSPLRALSNDIKKNLMIPLEGIKKEAPFADIRVFVRTGDTPAHKKSKMLKKPPHILITTPETLQIILNAPKFREKLVSVKYDIVDEIHDLCDSKRGVSLSLSLERLQELAGPFVRIGLSATQAPVEEIGRFLAGVDRPVRILTAEKEKKYDITIVKPQSLSSLSLEKAVEETYDILKDLIESHNVTLVFSNTRSRTERIVYQLKDRQLYSVAAHHGSMSTETRHEIEHLLKKGQIKAVITSTSLELGIDIGDIDLVVQLGSPKNTAKLMQRIGRAGHGLGAVSKGVLVAQDRDELIELEILKRKALEYRLEPVQIPQNCLDVLAQHLVGMSLEKVWSAEEAFQLVRRSSCFRNLEYTEFLKVLEYLGGYYSDLEEKHVYRKLWFDGQKFGRVKASKYLYFLNCGTIPSEATFVVFLDNIPLGTLSEHFVSYLKPRDIFVLGGRSLEFVKIEGMRVMVKDAQGGKPTVPSWRGEVLSRSYEFARDLSRYRKEIQEKMDCEDQVEADSRNYFKEQKKAAGFIPTCETLLVERYIDGDGLYHLIFHFPFGRRVNEALARGYGQKLNCSDFTVTDNGFMLNSGGALTFTKEVLPSEELMNILRASVWDTELFCQRFRHCAERGFLLLKSYRGKSVSPRTQYFRARSLMRELPFDFPLVKETFNEVLYSALDSDHAVEVLEKIESGEMDIVVSDYTTIPSPFALSIVMAGAQDVITLKDRSEFLQHMQKALTERILEAQPAFDPEMVEAYYAGREREKRGIRDKREEILDILYTGIKTAQEIASEIGETKREAEKILDELIEGNLISCGYFTLPELQYMLLRDRRYLEYGEGIEDCVLKRFLVKKHFKYSTAREVFKAYGFLRSKRALYDRIGFFSQPLMKIKVGGRLAYILLEDAPLFVSAYRENLPEDRKILDYIRENPGLKRKEIAEALGSDFSTLEDNLHVYRDEDNRFYILDIKVENKSEAKKEIVRKYVGSCGPVSKEEILYYTRFQREDLEVLNDSRKVIIFSKIVQEMYCTEEDYEALKRSDSESGKVQIIDHTDPLYDKVKYERSYPEEFSLIVMDGRVVGGLLHESNESFLVEECILEDIVPSEELFREILRVYAFYRWQGARNIVLKPENLKKMAESAGYYLDDEKLVDAPPFEISTIHVTQLKNQYLLERAPLTAVMHLPFLDSKAAQKRIKEDIQALLKEQKIVEVTYKNKKYVCLPEDRKIYEENNVQELITRLMDSFIILSPFQVKTLVEAELYEIENVLKNIGEKVYFRGEIHYFKEGEMFSTDETIISFLPVTDPFVALHNEKWLLEGTAILVNGSPAGYYTLDKNQADLNLFKEFKPLWGSILVKLPSENISIRTINGRPVKDTRFARAFS